MQSEGRKQGFPLVLTIALYFGAWLVLSWPFLSGKFTIPWDAKAHFYPQLSFLAQAIGNGQWPFWNPYTFAGMPQIADPQSLIFSLPHLLVSLFDHNPSFVMADAIVLGLLGLGGLSIVMLFRDFNWHWGGAMIAAVAFSHGGSAAWRIQHTGQILSISWFVISFWILNRALLNNSLRSGAAAGFVAAMMVLGRDQIALLGLYFLTLTVIVHYFNSDDPKAAFKRSLGPLLMGALVGTVIVSFPLLMTWLMAESSNRPVIDYEGAGRGSMHPWALLTLLIPNLYGVDGPLVLHWGPPSPAWGPLDLFIARNMSALFMGSVPMLAIILIGFGRQAFKHRQSWILLGGFALAVFYALGRYTPLFDAFYHLPGTDLFRRPADATYYIGAFGAMLGGYCVSRALDNTLPDRNPLAWRLSLLAVIAWFTLAVGLALFKHQSVTAELPILMASGFCVVAVVLLVLSQHSFNRSIAPWLAVVLFVLQVSDVRVNNGPNESTALPSSSFEVLKVGSQDRTLQAIKAFLKEDVSPDHRDRIEVIGVNFHWANATMVQKIDNALGYNPLRLANYVAATGAGDHTALISQKNYTKLQPSYHSLLTDMLGVRLIVSSAPMSELDPKADLADFPLLELTRDAYIYENPRALPRVMLVPKVVAADQDAILKSGEWPVHFDPQAQVVLSPDDAAKVTNGGIGNASLKDCDSQKVEVEVNAPWGGVLVLNDVWHPWWRATVDGHEQPIMRANVIFRAVAVPPGQHTVSFVFTPIQGALEELKSRLQKAGLSGSH